MEEPHKHVLALNEAVRGLAADGWTREELKDYVDRTCDAISDEAVAKMMQERRAAC